MHPGNVDERLADGALVRQLLGKLTAITNDLAALAAHSGAFPRICHHTMQGKGSPGPRPPSSWTAYSLSYSPGA